MPVLTSSYTPPFWLQGGHAQTLYPALFRKPLKLAPQRRQCILPDGDIINFDCMYSPHTPAKGVILLLHGMEGHCRKPYITGMAHTFLQAGWDCVARNCRGCGERINTGPGLYHSGQTDDIHTLITTLLATQYDTIALVGFSMGGNQTLKYLGEYAKEIPSAVKAAVAFSVPCDLAGCTIELARPTNILYMHNFLHTLRQKVRQKHTQYPHLYPLRGLSKIRSFAEFDERYTAPLHGYSSAMDYWTKASCLSFLPQIHLPTLLLSAKNDPFLSRSCYPEAIAASHKYLHAEFPKQGGHVGFVACSGKNHYWAEARALQFISEHV